MNKDFTSLVEEAKAGNCTRLFTQFQPLVRKVVVSRVRNVHDAEEVCQDVFMRVIERIGQLRHPRALARWLVAVANSTALNSTRNVFAHPVDPQVIEATHTHEETPLDILLRREEGNLVRAGVERLRKTDREALLAFYFEGLCVVEMSKRFGCPEGSVKRRLHYARKRLAEELQ